MSAIIATAGARCPGIGHQLPEPDTLCCTKHRDKRPKLTYRALLSSSGSAAAARCSCPSESGPVRCLLRHCYCHFHPESVQSSVAFHWSRDRRCLAVLAEHGNPCARRRSTDSAAETKEAGCPLKFPQNSNVSNLVTTWSSVNQAMRLPGADWLLNRPWLTAPTAVV